MESTDDGSVRGVKILHFLDCLPAFLELRLFKEKQMMMILMQLKFSSVSLLKDRGIGGLPLNRFPTFFIYLLGFPSSLHFCFRFPFIYLQLLARDD